MRVRLVHHHPGRLRFRSEAFTGASSNGGPSIVTPSLVETLVAALEALPAVRAAHHDGRTGSVLVEYDVGHLEPDVIVERVREVMGCPILDPDASPRERYTVGEQVVLSVRRANRAVAGATGSRADLRALVPGLLAAVSAVSFVFRDKDRWPRWDTWLFGSVNLFAQFHQREIRRHEIRHDEARAARNGAPRGPEEEE